MATKLGTENPRTPKATEKPTKVDLAWAAGFIEGEGSFSYNAWSQCISVGQVQREPLERLQKWFGGSLKYHNRKQSPLFVWTVFGARARGVMMTLFAWMSPKRQLEIKTVLSGKGSKLSA